MNIYETTIEFNDIEIDVEIDFDYDAPEKMTRDYPGYPESVFINEVTTSAGVISLSKDEIDDLRDEILDWIHEK